ncbi:hypothetical protein [Sphingobium lactosutens]|uniref:hypothetical protein n=1 Tax=Sphingobium lactosutens TaxID=522773 RepID=UPI0012686E25|nr:hypothetical protein [Sphingobium lactosutens]
MSEIPLHELDEHGNTLINVPVPMVELAYLKSPFKSITLPPPFIEPVGNLILAWGMIEECVNNLIERLQKTTDLNVNERWKRENYSKRAQILRKALNKYLSLYPKSKSYLVDMMNVTSPINWKRNLLVHGQVSIGVMLKPDGNHYHYCGVAGVHNGKAVALKLSIHDIKVMYYDLGHVAAKFSDLSQGCDHAATILPSRDIRKLQALFGDS